MSHRHDSSPLIAGSHIISDGGLGVLAETVPSGGIGGAGFLFADLSFPADTGAEVRGEILTVPSDGDFFAYPDSSFELLNAPDGTYTFTYQYYRAGVATNPVATVTINVGSVGITASGNVISQPDSVSANANLAMTAVASVVNNSDLVSASASMAMVANAAVANGGDTISASSELGTGGTWTVAVDTTTNWIMQLG